MGGGKREGERLVIGEMDGKDGRNGRSLLDMLVLEYMRLSGARAKYPIFDSSNKAALATYATPTPTTQKNNENVKYETHPTPSTSTIADPSFPPFPPFTRFGDDGEWLVRFVGMRSCPLDAAGSGAFPL